MASECIHCGAVDEPEDGIVVGLLGDDNANVCNVCRTQGIYDATVLSKGEARVVALKELTGATHERIAELLDLEKSTVDEFSRRANEKLEKSKRTVALLD